jgi:hypothetical protein
MSPPRQLDGKRSARRLERRGALAPTTHVSGFLRPYITGSQAVQHCYSSMAPSPVTSLRNFFKPRQRCELRGTARRSRAALRSTSDTIGSDKRARSDLTGFPS